MSFILLGILNSQAAGAAAQYWLATLGGTENDNAQGVDFDSLGNAYVAGFTRSEGLGQEEALLTKYDTFGSIQWQRILGGTGGDFANSVMVDGSDNVYFAGATNSIGAGGFDGLVAKYNSSGALQWQRILGGSGADSFRGIALAPTGEFYAAGISTSAGFGGFDYLIIKYDNTGAIVYQRVTGASETDTVDAIAVNSAGLFAVTGQTNSFGSGSLSMPVTYYNSGGNLLAQRVMNGSGLDIGNGVAFDSSNNAYFVGQTTSIGAGSYDLFLTKFDSSRLLEWQVILGGASSDEGKSVAVDSSGNVYVAGNTNSAGAGSTDLLIAKYNSSGTIQWQRVLGGASADSATGIKIDDANNIWVTGFTSSAGAGGQDLFIAKLPSDGSLTGTYVLNGSNITYQASSLTAATATLTNGSTSFSNGTPSLTSSAATLTDSASTLTPHLAPIG